MKDLCNLFDYRDLRGLVSSIAKKLKDDKYFMIEFPIPSLDSVYHFILIHFFFLTRFNIKGNWIYL